MSTLRECVLVSGTPNLALDIFELIFSVVEKSRDHKSKFVGSITLPTLYLIKEDGDPSLKLWAQTLLVEDRADQGESIVQWISKLREKVCPDPQDVPLILSSWPD